MKLPRSDTLETRHPELWSDEPVFVTRPTMPSLAAYHEMLEGIWARRWLTNDGVLHRELEEKLRAYFGVRHFSLVSSGTTALLIALQALEITGGEVITTPFTFPATPHVLHWSRVTPVFCDLEADGFNLDPSQIVRLIRPETKAILGVHAYGFPCDVEAIAEVADAHGLKVVYDAAHAVGVRRRGRSAVSYGDVSALSFHATKLFSTGEGGGLVARSALAKRRVDLLRNFGIVSEEEVVTPGLNGKLSELHAAFGLLHLQHLEQEIAAREAVAGRYEALLSGVSGISLPTVPEGVRWNYAYYPIRVDEEAFGASRDRVYDALKRCNIHPRKYFHPLCSRFPCYSSHPSAAPERLPHAERVASEVLCLPIYGTLEESTVERVCAAVVESSRVG